MPLADPQLETLPGVGDHVKFWSKQRVRWEYGTVTEVSSQNPKVFHVLDHNPLLYCKGDGEPMIWELAQTVHLKRIIKVIPKEHMCSCGHGHCPCEAQYKKRWEKIRVEKVGDYCHEIIEAPTEEEADRLIKQAKEWEARFAATTVVLNWRRA